MSETTAGEPDQRKNIDSHPTMPAALAPLLTTTYQAADRAWTNLQSFMVAQSLLILAWAQISNGDLLGKQDGSTRSVILVFASTIGALTGLFWSLLCTRMWHYHLEYAEELVKLTHTLTEKKSGPGASAWKAVDDIVHGYWRDPEHLSWFRIWSGNHWVLFLTPLFLSSLHMVMLGWVLWTHGLHASTFLVAMVFILGVAIVWVVCRRALLEDYRARRERHQETPS